MNLAQHFCIGNTNALPTVFLLFAFRLFSINISQSFRCMHACAINGNTLRAIILLVFICSFIFCTTEPSQKSFQPLLKFLQFILEARHHSAFLLLPNSLRLLDQHAKHCYILVGHSKECYSQRKMYLSFWLRQQVFFENFNKGWSVRTVCTLARVYMYINKYEHYQWNRWLACWQAGKKLRLLSVPWKCIKAGS